MAAPAITYAFYTNQYGGALDEEGFDASLPHALAYVGRRIWPNDPRRAVRAWRMAVCAAVDVDAAYGATGGAGALASVTTGTVSMGFGGQGGSSWEADMARAVDARLAGTGLLYMGLG